MMRWMINCQKHSILTSENFDRTLTLWERFSVWLHEKLCPPCSNFQKQLKMIREACREAYTEDGVIDPDACNLPDEIKEQMKSALREAHAKK